MQFSPCRKCNRRLVYLRLLVVVMRYLVETEDTLVLKNIQLNNKCTITPAADNVVGEADFHETYSPEIDVYMGVCPVCGRSLSAVHEHIRYCMRCGTRNTGGNDELDTDL